MREFERMPVRFSLLGSAFLEDIAGYDAPDPFNDLDGYLKHLGAEL